MKIYCLKCKQTFIVNIRQCPKCGAKGSEVMMEPYTFLDRTISKGV